MSAVNLGLKFILELTAVAMTPMRSCGSLIAGTVRATSENGALDEEHGAILVEYDLLGDHLQEDELMTALATIARLADRQDDVLQLRFGGARAFEREGSSPTL